MARVLLRLNCWRMLILSLVCSGFLGGCGSTSQSASVSAPEAQLHSSDESVVEVDSSSLQSLPQVSPHDDSSAIEGDVEQVLIEGQRPAAKFIEDAENIDMLRQDETIYFVADQFTTKIDDESAQLQVSLQLQGPPEPHWAVSGRHFIASSIAGAASSVDHYIADVEQHAEVPSANNTLLRLRVGQTWQDGGELINKVDLKLKVDLPRSKERIGFVFDSSAEEFESLESQNRESLSGEQRVRDSETSTAAFRFALDFWESWKPDMDVGMRAALPLDPFLRFRLTRDFELNDNWRLLSRNAFYYYYQDGGGEQSSLSFTRPVQDNVLYINKSEMRWVHDKRLLTFSNVHSVTHLFDNRRVFTYRAGVFYEHHPTPEVTSYFVDWRYRHRLHDDWLYVELIPSLTWPRTNDFDEVAELTLRFEIFFRD